MGKNKDRRKEEKKQGERGRKEEKRQGEKMERSEKTEKSTTGRD